MKDVIRKETVSKDVVRKNVSNRMSQVVSANGFIFLSGQVADDLTGDIRQQTACVLNKITQLLTSVAVPKANLVDVKIYLRNAQDFAQMNAVYEAWLEDGHQPVRLCLVADFPNPDYLVEIQAQAVSV